uniref:Uncharacterized protein n=1 Tax=Ditylenchus dipsaci TaxID=166011 RepID=A0A915EPQ8_9BILA
MSTLKTSTVTMYASTLSAAGFGLFGGGSRYSNGEDPLEVNLYTLMAKYRCCCGMCRLRVGCFLIAVFSIIYPLLVIAALVVCSPWLTTSQKTFLSIPVIVLMGFQLFASTLMLTGLFINLHYMLLPFQFSCIINMMGSMGLGVIMLVSTERTNTQLYPGFAVFSTGLVGIYLWFLVICSMTFVLIRDKKRMTSSLLDFGNNPFNGDEEVVSTHLERVNSAEF